MKQITKTFLKGLIAVVPITLTLYLLYWLAVTAELVLGNIFKLFLPDNWYIHGMGFVSGLVAIFFVGGFLESENIRHLFRRIEQYILRIPLIKSIYTTIHDLIWAFFTGLGKELTQVVLVDVPAIGGKQIGIITCSDFSGFSNQLKEMDDQVAVFLPFSYQIGGGFTVIMPRTSVEPLAMPVEDALRFVATAGVIGHTKGALGAPPPMKNNATARRTRKADKAATSNP